MTTMGTCEIFCRCITKVARHFDQYSDAVACGKPTQKADQQRIAYAAEASGSGAFHRFMRALDEANLQVRRRTRPALYRALA